MTTFTDWLDGILRKEGWRAVDLEKAAGISHSTISLWYSRNSEPADQSLQKIARALKLPEDVVFEAAGRIKKKANDDPIEPTSARY
jgi:transcriptional regulator with XRE-family HTH domain